VNATATNALPIIIVEPNAVLRESMKHYLELEGYTIAGAVDNARSVANLDSAPSDVTIILNGARSDIAADFRLLRALRSNARFVVYGGRSELKATLEAIQCGATVYLDDKAHALMFLKSLELAARGFVTVSIAMHGETIQLPERMSEITPAKVLAPLENADATDVPPRSLPASADHGPAAADREPAPTFSPRETAILQLLQEGAPNKVIARHLSLTEATVKVHLKSILRKIRVTNRTQAALWAMGQEALSSSESGSRSSAPAKEEVPRLS
jgi:two-component system, NarL family, nitrate/nitrite response regulator NarL